MMSVDIEGLEKLLKKLPNEKMIRLALKESLNKSAISGREASRQEVAKDYTIKAGKFRKTAKITKATNANLEAKVTWLSEMTNLANFDITPKRRTKRRPKKQMVASVKRGRGATYKGVFIGPNNRTYRRTGIFKIVNGLKREKIGAVYGTSATHLARGDKPREKAKKAARDMLQKRIQHEVSRMLSK